MISHIFLYIRQRHTFDIKKVNTLNWPKKAFFSPYTYWGFENYVRTNAFSLKQCYLMGGEQSKCVFRIFDPVENHQKSKKTPDSTIGFLEYWTRKIVILGQKTSKTTFSRKLLSHGRRTIEMHFFANIWSFWKPLMFMKVLSIMLLLGL